MQQEIESLKQEEILKEEQAKNNNNSGVFPKQFSQAEELGNKNSSTKDASILKKLAMLSTATSENFKREMGSYQEIKEADKKDENIENPETNELTEKKGKLIKE
eukprot:CAMPEP_0170533830 /NCGR_PEP_ID=MMETSP0209-20121228/85561_1 /TAXON_ID=665100 ORGANISM="Litonotus pictus, Strain P1" /NCGR_SAMPLE_ID=MMETSP0209 /ASSEMBLY_ACC=CAM_ASM_000301 /LENGTH=103 /DNA_ID=CAMNT_0010832149 /DNA_START=1 /DNA_END=309 /DNA_ORIENTATION=-